MNKKKMTVKSRILISACVIAALLIASLVIAIAVENKEYSAAVAFFEENGLSKDGLTRKEVKAVYRDITEKSFKLGKTAEVLGMTVSGSETEADPPPATEGPDETQKTIGGSEKEEFAFFLGSVPVTDGNGRDSRNVLICRSRTENVWTAEFPEDIRLYKFIETKSGVAVFGKSKNASSSGTVNGYTAFVNFEGKLLWQCATDHALAKNELVEKALENADGSLAVFGRGDSEYLCVSRYSPEGSVISSVSSKIDGITSIRCVAGLGSGFLVSVELKSVYDTRDARLIKLDGKGNITGDYSYSEDGREVFITSIMEYGGRVYLSAYSVPKQYYWGKDREIGDVFHAVFSDKYGWDGRKLNIETEELTALFTANYTAVLLVCDPDNVAPKTLYTVPGCLGGELSDETDGSLAWDVNGISRVSVYPEASSFTFRGSGPVQRYLFGADGQLVEKTETDKTFRYTR